MVIVVPARGGSKRLPGKNISLLGGKPLLIHTLEQAVSLGRDVEVFVSTEDEQIASLVRDYPEVNLIMRPDELASDTATTESVLLHVLDKISESGLSPEWLMTLPPTSPFRSATTIRHFIDVALDCGDNIDCVMSVTETRGDFWFMDVGGRMQRMFPDAPRRQQDRSPLFEENSAIYVSRTKALRETKFILGKSVKGIKISSLEGFDINSIEDLKVAESLFSNGIIDQIHLQNYL